MSAKLSKGKRRWLLLLAAGMQCDEPSAWAGTSLRFWINAKRLEPLRRFLPRHRPSGLLPMRNSDAYWVRP